MKWKLPLLIFPSSTENHTKHKKHKKNVGTDFHQNWSSLRCADTQGQRAGLVATGDLCKDVAPTRTEDIKEGRHAHCSLPNSL